MFKKNRIMRFMMVLGERYKLELEVFLGKSRF